MRFRDRVEAGRLLAEALREKLPDKVLTGAAVYALPRGGVVPGYMVAKTLALPLDIVVARKIGHPQNEEYAVCAISEDGTMLCDESERMTLSPDWLATAAERERQEARRRRELYGTSRPRVLAQGRTAIIVDDGIATGLTMRAVIAALRKEEPERLVVAAPCAPAEVAATLREEADDVIILAKDEYLGAVGAYYSDFPQVSDEEVIRLLTAG